MGSDLLSLSNELLIEMLARYVRHFNIVVIEIVLTITGKEASRSEAALRGVEAAQHGIYADSLRICDLFHTRGILVESYNYTGINSIQKHAIGERGSPWRSVQ